MSRAEVIMMFRLKYDRYFRFEIIYDEEINALGAGLIEYDPSSAKTLMQASIYIDSDDEEQALNEVMRIILSRTGEDEKITVRERGYYFIDLREQYPEIAFRYLQSDRVQKVEELANKALDEQKTEVI